MPNKSSAMKLMLLGLAILTMASACLGQSYWKRTYGGTGNDVAYAITPTPDGNFIVAGQTNSFGAGGYDVYLIKIKPNGDTLWTKTYGGTGYDVSYALTPASGGDFIVAGGTCSFQAQGENVYLLKVNSNGDTLWTRTYGGTNFVIAYAVTPTLDGNFIVAGGNPAIGEGKGDVYLLKVDSNGDTLWTRTYGGTGDDWAYAITPTQDGNFIVAGMANFNGAEKGDIYLLKITPGGDTLWTKTYGGVVQNVAYAITPTLDGNFFVAGSTFSGGGDAFLLKVRPNGDTLWTKTYGGKGYDDGKAITPTSDGNFILVGWMHSFNGAPGNIYLFKINSNGDTLWTKTYGGIDDDRAFAITPTQDGNFVVAGYTYSLGTGGGDIWLISIINDITAKKDSLFTFKIPVSGDSLNHGFTPLKVPSGMTVSMGGTISWTPKTDSVYMDHAEFLVSDDFGKKDTLTFNVFVNSKDHPNKIINPVSRSANPSLSGITIHSISSKEVRFSLPGGASLLRVYDVRGQLLENLSVKGGRATWRPGHAAGRYFAKAIVEKKEMVRSFIVVR